MHHRIESARHAIAQLCRANGVLRLDVFGSALSDEFDDQNSDLDAVVEFDPADPRSGLARYFSLKQQLEALLSRPVDLVELNALPETRLKRLIQKSKVPFYAAAA